MTTVVNNECYDRDLSIIDCCVCGYNPKWSDECDQCGNICLDFLPPYSASKIKVNQMMTDDEPEAESVVSYYIN